MTSTTLERLPAALTRRIPSSYVPPLTTLGLLVLMVAIAGGRYEGIASPQVLLNVFIDNSFLLVLAVGMTFVILTGGIDLSVGSMLALSTMLSATLVENSGWSPPAAIALVLVVGALLGLGMGCMVHFFEIQPFIATLAGMFLARGLCYVISTDSIPIRNDFYSTMASTAIPLPGGVSVTPSVVVALVVVAIAAYVLHYTRLGRNVYAIGGNEQSALLMGLPVGRTKVLVYVFSGFCSALGGVLYTFYTSSGYSLNGIGFELDAIAAVVIGGAVLSGGTGYVLGSVLGVLVTGFTLTIINFQGTLSSWWTRIVIALLLLAFILLQQLVFSRRRGPA